MKFGCRVNERISPSRRPDRRPPTTSAYLVQQVGLDGSRTDSEHDEPDVHGEISAARRTSLVELAREATADHEPAVDQSGDYWGQGHEKSTVHPRRGARDLLDVGGSC